ncbi:glycoside hydrolase family 2 [Cryobacterium lactosi]|uniref:Glycoside hydrolase family 2 n=1 Tax=Cryobacterium lactosi TaxID=1259202 RepID=A0A4R9BIP5_9MICO|nr:sugar-binding domain-containing protein [Cryobacterium lactosi]TFD85444.1 glycoside hydrolase family 2 [Cryobacterium lactosi]
MSSSVDLEPAVFRASQQDGRYPRPQLVRPSWAELSGEWGFAFDDADIGLTARWFADPQFDRKIQVPFPFESAASGIQDTGFHKVAWYSRTFDDIDLAEAGFFAGQRLHVRFGAVDYRASVWVDGTFLGQHEGGHTPFSFDITDAVVSGLSEHTIVVRAEDDPLDVTQPRGKQDWRVDPHSIWYHRTSGIWQPVWLESTNPLAVTLVHWVPDLPNASVRVRVDLSRRPAPGTTVSLSLSFDGVPLSDTTVAVTATTQSFTLAVPVQMNGQAYEELLWTPESPRLIDATLTVRTGSTSHVQGTAVDVVHSYLGLRSAAVARGRFLLNDRPYYVRSVLQQGYWPESHLASPSPEALRRDVELIKELGFNATRVHQKIEDPRFLYWTDRLGLLVWGETPGAFEFGATAVQRMLAEWTEVIERDLSHPSLVTWVPLNESWGVQHIAHNPAQQNYARALAALTRTLDPSRPVISNDGWEHIDSDILSVHDYESSGDILRERYSDEHAKHALLGDLGPAGRRLLLPGQEIGERPVMLTEFGGISFATQYTDSDAWGYSSAQTADDFLERMDAVVSAVHTSAFLAGFCYTQLTDTLQETNGLLDENRMPKAPMRHLRAIVTQSAPATPALD